MPASRYGIAEWYGHSFVRLPAIERRQLAGVAVGADLAPPCPFRDGGPPCRKRGGVCSFQRYEESGEGRVGTARGEPAILCPERFAEGHVLVDWLAEIVGISPSDVKLAREVPFMRGTTTGKPAGKIDLVVARTSGGLLKWFGLEIQAVYFSGKGMTSEFERLLADEQASPPFPNAVRRPDWRSSSAKRLMPQLLIKAPTVRRWGTKIAVAVDKPFFAEMGGPSQHVRQDLGDGDVIWMVPELKRNKSARYLLTRGHWEVLTLEESCERLLAAETIRQDAFERDLADRLVARGLPSLGDRRAQVGGAV